MGKKQKQDDKPRGPQDTVSCAYCGEMKTRRKTVSLISQPQYRICRHHFCLICRASLRPEDEIQALTVINGKEVVGPIHRSHIHKAKANKGSKKWKKKVS